MTAVLIQPSPVLSLHGRAAVLSSGEQGSKMLRPVPSSTIRHPPDGQLAGRQHDRDGLAEEPAKEEPAAPDSASRSDEFHHVPVMRDEVVDLLVAGASGRERPLFLDATLGAGGHAATLLERCPQAQVVGLDRDATALVAAERRLARYSDRLTTHHLRFDQLAEVVDTGSLAGVLFDLGVSSPQIDRAGRGFSFRQTGPLDMRMNADDALSADEIVNNWDEADLARVIWRHGDEKQARRIASAIVKSRPVLDTTSLSEIVADALPAAVRRKTRQPSAKTFQALRIEVNSELDVIEPALLAAIDSLDIGGRLVVLAYHSGEDRIVKSVMKDESRVVSGRRDLPPPPDAKVRMRLVFNGAHKPLTEEIEANSRARSARLRAAERIEGPK